MPLPIVFTDMRSRAKGAPPLDARRADEAIAALNINEPERDRLRDLMDRAREIAERRGETFEASIQLSGENDPLFRTVRNKLAGMALVDAALTHVGGRLDSQRRDDPADDLTDREKLLAAVYGILERDNDVKPDVERFNKAVTAAVAEYSEDKDRFDATLGVLIKAGTPKRRAGGERQVDASQWAAVVRTLRDQRINAEDPHLDEVATGVLVDMRGTDSGLTPSAIDIDLPSLEDDASIEIIEPNLHAMQALYFASMLEELKVFQVVDKLVEQFHYGLLPLGKGRAGDTLYRYWKQSDDRFTELERRNLYERAFGFPGGEAQGTPNREFNDLWLRFVSAVSSFERQRTVDNLLQARTPGSISQEQVRKSGRDLAGNLSLHGYGIAYFAATELQDQIKEIIELLSDLEIKNAYGAKDIWQVVDQVATLELGGAKNSIRYRTMANAGAVIVRWLGNRSKILASSSLTRVLELKTIQEQITAESQGKKPTLDPTDYDLVNACEQWLAVTGTPEAQVEEYAQPFEPPMQTSRPIQIPAAARDLLESVGISAGYNGRRNGTRALIPK